MRAKINKTAGIGGSGSGRCYFWEINFLLEKGERKDDMVEKVSNKRVNTGSCKVSLEAKVGG